MDKYIYNKLTESAKSALEETTEEVKELIIEKAFQYANQKKTGNKEISLRDIIEAKEHVFFKKVIDNGIESKRKRIFLLFSMTGAVYSLFGILIYLYQNKSLDTTQDLGLIVAALGILLSLISFLGFHLLSKRKFDIIKDKSIIQRKYSEFGIVRRWQNIEKLGAVLMEREGLSDSAMSINHIIKYLSIKLLDFINTDQLRKLLEARNQIVHNDINMSNMEIEEMIQTADKILDELERMAENQKNNKV